jgi:hypothetical protein
MKVFSNPSSVECFELYYLFLPTHLSKSWSVHVESYIACWNIPDKYDEQKRTCNH